MNSQDIESNFTTSNSEIAASDYSYAALIDNVCRRYAKAHQYQRAEIASEMSQIIREHLPADRQQNLLVSLKPGNSVYVFDDVYSDICLGETSKFFAARFAGVASEGLGPLALGYFVFYGGGYEYRVPVNADFSITRQD